MTASEFRNLFITCCEQLRMINSRFGGMRYHHDGCSGEYLNIDVTTKVISYSPDGNKIPVRFYPETITLAWNSLFDYLEIFDLSPEGIIMELQGRIIEGL